MVTVPERLVEAYLRIGRANAPFVTADGARRRVRERAIRPSSFAPPRGLRRDVRIDVRHERGWPVYTVSPNRGATSGSVVYAHGGGWVGQIARQHWQLIAQIAAEVGTIVTVPIYPLVPFGDAEEAADGFARIVAHNQDVHGPTALAGDSAGGQIALSTALRLRDAGVARPAIVLIAPALDLSWSNPRIPEVQPSDPWLGVPGGRVLADLWRGDRDVLDPLVSPLFGDVVGLRGVTLFSGTRDVLNPDAHALVAKAREAGVPIEFHEATDQLHVYPLLPTRTGAAARRIIVTTLAEAVA